MRDTDDRSPFRPALIASIALAAPAASQSGAVDDLELRATWSEIETSSHRRHEQPEWRAVLQPGPAEPARRYGWPAFAALLPGAGVAVGEVFEVEFDAVAPFLRQLHPRPRERSHMGRLGYSGVHAVLLERTAERVDVLLRAHTEFELREDEVFFTVSQLEGRLIAEPDARRVVGFRLAVPPRTYNYDVHLRDGRRTLIDIGRVRRLGVEGGELPDEAPAALAAPRRALRRAFYPFEKVEWLTLAEGLERAAARRKPLHLITIFGPLDDEAC